MIFWLLNGGPKDTKHLSKLHPLMTFSLHYLLVAIVTVSAHDWIENSLGRYPKVLDDRPACIPPERQRGVGIFFGIYFLAYFGWRLILRWRLGDIFIEFYKQTFLCSVTIFHSALGFYTNRPILAEAFCVAVALDHILWYVDLAGYLIIQKFPIGVARYLFWPGTTWASRITATHHLWTIPLVLWASGGLHFSSLPLSFVVIAINVVLSRLMTPHYIAINEKDMVYLNLNLAYELWPDIKMKFLMMYEDKLPYIFRLFIAWTTFNTIVFGLLYVASERILGPASQC